MDSKTVELMEMVKGLRVKELKELCEFAGYSKYGNRSDLLERCLLAVKETKDKIPELASKIKELHLERNKNLITQPLLTIPGEASPPKSRHGTNSVNSGMSRANVSSSLPSTGKTADNPGSGMGGVSSSSINQALSATPPIKMIQLPFFDVKAVLLPPTVLVNEKYPATELASCQQLFRITKPQFSEILESYSVARRQYTGKNSIFPNLQLHIRFFAMDHTAAEQEDSLPLNLEVRVNGIVLALPRFLPRTGTTAPNTPKVEPLRLSIPTYIPGVFLKSDTDNIISVKWEQRANGRDFGMAIYYVRRVTSLDLLKRVKNQMNEVTIALLNEIISTTVDGIAPPKFLPVSLLCPLGKMRMAFPCRAVTCRHLQCFDAESFLKMNEVKDKPTFKCPVCSVNLKFEDLRIDMYHSSILRSLLRDELVDLFPDGSFKPAGENRKTQVTVGPLKRKCINDDGIGQVVAPTAPSRKIVLIDLEDEDGVSSVATSTRGISVIDIGDSDDDEATSFSVDELDEAATKPTPQVIDIGDSDDDEATSFSVDELDEAATRKVKY